LVHLFKTDLFTCSILSIPSLIEWQKLDVFSMHVNLGLQFLKSR
jgi:hypothetical protein